VRDESATSATHVHYGTWPQTGYCQLPVPLPIVSAPTCVRLPAHSARPHVCRLMCHMLSHSPVTVLMGYCTLTASSHCYRTGYCVMRQRVPLRHDNCMPAQLAAAELAVDVDVKERLCTGLNVLARSIGLHADRTGADEP
jgi:hypothetical protein